MPVVSFLINPERMEDIKQLVWERFFFLNEIKPNDLTNKVPNRPVALIRKANEIPKGNALRMEPLRAIIKLHNYHRKVKTWNVTAFT